MKLKELAIGLAALSLSLIPQAVRSQESDAAPPSGLLAQGEDLARGGRWQKAQEYFLKACSQNPANVLALHDLAVSYAHTNNLGEAAECERKALALDDKYVPAHIELAWVLGKQDDKNGAREHLKRALELDPQNKTALKNLQAIMARFRRQAPAMPAHTELIVEPEAERVRVAETPVSKALVARGANMFRQGKYEVARRFYEQALQNCPDSLVARSSLGVVRGSTGDIDGQIKEERLALLLQPQDTTALCNLAWGLAQKGDLKEALFTYQKALSLCPSMVDAQVGQGILLYRVSKPEAAVAVLKESVRVSPEQPLLRLSLAAVLQSLERNAEAIAQYQEASRLSPNNQEVKSRMAAAYLSSEKFDKAGELYRQLVERSPANAEFRIGLGLVLTKSNDINAAYQQFKKAAELDKNLAAAHACLSMIEEVKGRLSQAETEVQLAQDKDPDSKFLKDSAERLARSRKETEM